MLVVFNYISTMKPSLFVISLQTLTEMDMTSVTSAVDSAQMKHELGKFLSSDQKQCSIFFSYFAFLGRRIINGLKGHVNIV